MNARNAGGARGRGGASSSQTGPLARNRADLRASRGSCGEESQTRHFGSRRSTQAAGLAAILGAGILLGIASASIGASPAVGDDTPPAPKSGQETPPSPGGGDTPPAGGQTPRAPGDPSAPGTGTPPAPDGATPPVTEGPPAPPAPTPPPIPKLEPLVEAARLLRLGRGVDAAPLVEEAIASGKTDIDTLILWQDAVGAGPDAPRLVEFFRRRASEKPDDVVALVLAARTLAPRESAAACDKLVHKFASSPWPLAIRARAMEQMGRVTEALKSYDAAILLAPEEMRFRAGRALVLEAAGQWGDARDEWQRIVGARPDDFAAKVGLGEALRRLGDPAGALVALDAAAAAVPWDPEPAYRQGLARADAAQWDEAVSAFDRALLIAPTMFEPLCAASNAVLRKVEAAAAASKKVVVAADLDPAVRYADRAVAALPDRPEGYVARGAIHEVAGDADAARWDAALADYQAALDRIPIPGPAMVRVLLSRAHVQMLTERYDDAVASALRGSEIEPKNDATWAAAGEALMAQGEDEEAVKRIWRPGIRAIPESARLRHGHGLSLWRIDKLTEAAKEFKEAVRLAPNDGRYHLSYGEVLYQSGKEKDAVVELQLATAQMPDSAKSWSCFGHALVSTQKWKEAAEAFENACGLDAQAVDEHLALAVIYADRLKQKDLGRTHARTWRERGGKDSVLDSWIDGLLSGK